MSGCPLLAAATRIHSDRRFISSLADPQVKLQARRLDLPVVVDFIDEACHPDSNRGHANNAPKHQRSPPKFGGGDNPDTKGDYAGRDQICGESFHDRVQAEREPFRSISEEPRRRTPYRRDIYQIKSDRDRLASVCPFPVWLRRFGFQSPWVRKSPLE